MERKDLNFIQHLLERDIKRNLERKTHELIHVLDCKKDSILKELSGVDKVTLTHLRDIISDYYNAKATISDLAKQTLTEFETAVSETLTTAKNGIDEIIEGIVSDTVNNSSEFINEKVNEVIEALRKEFDESLSDIAILKQTDFERGLTNIASSKQNNFNDSINKHTTETFDTFKKQIADDIEQLSENFKQELRDYVDTLDIHAFLEETVMGKINELVTAELTEAKESGEFNGADGYTPVKGVDYFDGEKGDKGDKGDTGADGYTPVKGTDYWTETDKSEIVTETLAAIPSNQIRAIYTVKEGDAIPTGKDGDLYFTYKV